MIYHFVILDGAAFVTLPVWGIHRVRVPDILSPSLATAIRT